ncbi:transcription factor iws1 [Boletus coccyginus]|nr:transcription factor iws1 [Boletus coccyginus]
MAHAHTLERDIFGDGSELSSEEDDVPQHRQRVKPPVEQEPSGSSDESSDAYEHERPPKQKRTVKRRTDDRERKPQRKRKRKQITEQDLMDLPPEKANKLRLAMQFDAILKPKKGSRTNKRKKDAEDLDQFADEEVSRLREAMLGAALDDEQANREKLPATNKLKLLPQVMEVLRKQSLSQSIVDNNLLEGVRRWLEPLPDRSLPALNIQRDFFPVLKKMEFIDSDVLKESGLGRVVLFYTKCKRVQSDIQRIANDLVSTWSRPIINRSASYRDRVVPTAQEDASERANERLNAILARAKEGEKNRIRKNAVMIPQRELGNYTVAPRDNAGVMRKTVESDTARRKLNADRMRSLSRKISTKP